jgi:ABC-type multidrug transport system ATPase subunit
LFFLFFFSSSHPLSLPGLDASSSLELFKFCRVVADEAVPIVASPLQPSSDIYFLFDNLILLNSKGELVYFGAISDALPFFADLGFVCPETTNPADFLMEVSTLTLLKLCFALPPLLLLLPIFFCSLLLEH